MRKVRNLWKHIGELFFMNDPATLQQGVVVQGEDVAVYVHVDDVGVHAECTLGRYVRRWWRAHESALLAKVLSDECGELTCEGLIIFPVDVTIFLSMKHCFLYLVNNFLC